MNDEGQQQQQQQQQQQADVHKQTMKQMNTFASMFINTKSYGMMNDISFIKPDKPSEDGIQKVNKRKRKAITDIHEIFTDIQKKLIKAHQTLQKAQKLTYREAVMKHTLRHIQNVEQQKNIEHKEYLKQKKTAAAEASVEATPDISILHEENNDNYFDEPDFS